MDEAPQVGEWYTATVAKNPKIDMVFCTWDKNNAGLQKWISTNRPPYASVKVEAMQDKERIPLIWRHKERAMPWYVVVDREGKKVLDGATTMIPITNFIKDKL